MRQVQVFCFGCRAGVRKRGFFEMIQPERVKVLNGKPIRSARYVLYWMQAAQRAEYNHALEYAIEQANRLKVPVVTAFCLTEDYPEANERHYFFMLEGLRRVQASLEARGIRMVVLHETPEKAVSELSEDAALVVADGGQLRIQRRWRNLAARKVGCALVEVETNLIVPVEEASTKENFSAGTFRPRISKRLRRYLVGLRSRRPLADSLGLNFKSFDIGDVDKAVSRLRIDRSVGRVDTFCGGMAEAKRRLGRFLRSRLEGFAELRNDPCAGCASNMSPYLHFGQISALYIALKVKERSGPGREAYLEELIVRRELSHNFVFYNKDYDSFAGLAPWAKRTLNFHRRDKREYVYKLEEFEAGGTHDPYWNAAQKEMVLTGKMHGYMRMYWGKKILEWSASPQSGFKIALYLNNKYELDGRDPNGFAGVAWCFGKHDRAWGERPVFGKVRYMNAAGLKRKFDPDEYVRKVAGIERARRR
jgi:deoxyribodipyrimidine photo-lyase